MPVKALDRGVRTMSFTGGKGIAGAQQRRALRHVIKDLKSVKKYWKRIQKEIPEHRLTDMREDQQKLEEALRDMVPHSHKLTLFDLKFLDGAVQLQGDALQTIVKEEKLADQMKTKLRKALKDARKGLNSELGEFQSTLKKDQRVILSVQEETVGNTGVALSIQQHTRSSYNTMAQFIDAWRARRMGRDAQHLEKEVEHLSKLQHDLDKHKKKAEKLVEDSIAEVRKIIKDAQKLVTKAWQVLLVDMIAIKIVLQIVKEEGKFEDAWYKNYDIPKAFLIEDQDHRDEILSLFKHEFEVELRNINVVYHHAEKAKV